MIQRSIGLARAIVKETSEKPDINGEFLTSGIFCLYQFIHTGTNE